MAASGSNTAQQSSGAPAGGWTALIDDICKGNWTSPLTGETAPAASTETIVIAESLEGAEAELLLPRIAGKSLALVADRDTWDALGRRVAGALTAAGTAPREVVLETKPHADLATADLLAKSVEGAEHVVAVGSGTLNDLCKYVTFQDGRSCSVFGTAASMDGYASSTVSMGLANGLKVSLPAHAPRAVFLDLSVLAAAPPRLAASGFGDCLCSSVARVDWWMSHRLLGTFFKEEPYLIAAENEVEMSSRAAGIATGDLEAIGYLTRALILSGLGIGFTKVSNHGSMGEHQISHYIDCFARERHPGTLHGQQVGVASLTMARLQRSLLADDKPPRLSATKLDQDDMARRMGPEIAAQCAGEYAKKALDEAGAAAMNEKLEELWPELRKECLAVSIPVATLQTRLTATGGPTTGQELGLPDGFYQEAVRHAHEMRNRYSFADLACDAGLLDDIAAAAA